MSEKYLRMLSATTALGAKWKHLKYDPLKRVCRVVFEFDRACLDAAHLGLICQKLDAAFLELLLEHGYQVPVEPPVLAAKPGFKGPDFEEQGLFDENGGM